MSPTPTDPALRHPRPKADLRISVAMQAARHQQIEALRRRIGALPAAHDNASGDHPVHTDWAAHSASGWGLGVAEIDALLPRPALRPSEPPPRAAGLHEIKPSEPRDQAVAAAFALGILGRRARLTERPVLWVQPVRVAHEHGNPYGPGLAALGLAPEHCLIVATRTRQETLWAMEEGLKSRALGAVFGTLEALEMTPARRLVLAASVPCLVLTEAASPGAVVAHTRWRLASQPNPRACTDFNHWRCHLRLERCRQGGAMTAAISGGPDSKNEHDVSGWNLEWSHASFRFHLVAGLANRADAPAERRRPGAGSVLR